MRIVAIIPARMDSVRLPGKPLITLGGKRLMDRVLRRAQQIPGISDVVVATTDRGIDDPIVAFGQENGFRVFRGSAHDVARRFLECACDCGADYFVRANADSPFLEPSLIGIATQLCKASESDFVTNLVGRTFPYGVSVEVVKTSGYISAYNSMASSYDREHVTSYFYQHLSEFSVHTILCTRSTIERSECLTVDTPEDLMRLEALLEKLESVRGYDSSERSSLSYFNYDHAILYTAKRF